MCNTRSSMFLNSFDFANNVPNSYYLHESSSRSRRPPLSLARGVILLPCIVLIHDEYTELE
ncbi:expressed unknown protein [Ectocarpus siliculosus]|uniref:Uncharacterized protein n=1 Tax=Ectocarpus siliculosus TaxID=2880 RepID=D7FU73_ECTSI|nr:expressed unknown protein [Ectocarpus siliculosus]|eukprot:CBJ31600.1 expressed unknown protein [Ectocarpus siliculosus]